jgi:hypothetical protein
MLTRNEFIEYRAKFTEYVAHLKENKTEFNSDNWWSLEAMTPQKRGNFMQDTHVEKMSGLIKKISPKLKKGDFHSTNNKYFEYKFSMTDSKRDICFLQIRPHHPCDYVFEVYDNGEEKMYCFLISHKQMSELIKKYHSSYTHSSTTTMYSLRGSLNPKSKKYNLWTHLVENHLVDYDELRPIYST